MDDQAQDDAIIIGDIDAFLAYIDTGIMQAQWDLDQQKAQRANAQATMALHDDEPQAPMLDPSDD